MDTQVAILVALLALIGVVVAAIIQARTVNATLQQNGRVEVERWDREDKRRHERARQEAYPAFLALVDEGVLGMSAVLRGDTTGLRVHPHWDERLRGALAVIEFVGSRETIDSGQLLYRAVQRLRVGFDGVVQAAQAIEDSDSGDGDVDIDSDVPDGEAEVDGENAVEELSTDVPGEGNGAGESEDEELEAKERGTSMREFMEFVDFLPYPLGGDINPREMYFGNPFVQISMARAELRVRRHDFVNAARTDLGMGTVPYPKESAWHRPEDGEPVQERAEEDPEVGESV